MSVGWDSKQYACCVDSIPSYDDALDRVRRALATYAATPVHTPIGAELEDATRGAVHSARRDQIALPVIAADLGRLAAIALLGDVRAIEVARALAQYAARTYAPPS